MDVNSLSHSPSSSSSSNTPVRSQASTESAQSAQDASSQHTPGRHSSWNRSSSQPATLRNGTFNEISDGRWTYCIEPEKEEPAVIGFGKANIMNYKGMDKKLLMERKLKVCAVTWNINEKGVKVLNHLAKKISERRDETDSDVFFISFQEIPTTATTFHEDAFKILEPVLNGYRLYLSHRAYSQMVIVFIRKQHIKYAIEPQVSFIYSGSVVKPIRTKGAIAVCFRLYQRFIVLLGCHLTHATPEGRIQDYKKIVNTLRFPQLAKFRADGSNQIFAADVVLWVGDLNFRVTVENDVDWRNSEKIQDKVYDEVLKTEELATHKANKGFDGFNEAPIRFPPTHKFEPDSDNYVISTPKRIPSFTDRILYRTRNASWIQPIKYDCMRGPSPSDHKAVFATFSILVIDKPVPESHFKQLSLEDNQSSGTTNHASH